MKEKNNASDSKAHQKLNVSSEAKNVVLFLTTMTKIISEDLRGGEASQIKERFAEETGYNISRVASLARNINYKCLAYMNQSIKERFSKETGYDLICETGIKTTDTYLADGFEYDTLIQVEGNSFICPSIDRTRDNNEQSPSKEEQTTKVAQRNTKQVLQSKKAQRDDINPNTNTESHTLITKQPDKTTKESKAVVVESSKNRRGENKDLTQPELNNTQQENKAIKSSDKEEDGDVHISERNTPAERVSNTVRASQIDISNEMESKKSDQAIEETPIVSDKRHQEERQCHILIIQQNDDQGTIQNELRERNSHFAFSFKTIIWLNSQSRTIIDTILRYHLVLLSIQTYSFEIQKLLASIEYHLSELTETNRHVYVIFEEDIDISQYYFPSDSNVFKIVESIYNIPIDETISMRVIDDDVENKPTPRDKINPLYPIWTPQYQLGIYSSDTEKKTQIIIKMLIFGSYDDIQIDCNQLTIEEFYITIAIGGRNKNIEGNTVNFYLPIKLPKETMRYNKEEEGKSILKHENDFIEFKFELK